jgi:hypothetical protein
MKPRKQSVVVCNQQFGTGHAACSNVLNDIKPNDKRKEAELREASSDLVVWVRGKICLHLLKLCLLKVRQNIITVSINGPYHQENKEAVT